MRLALPRCRSVFGRRFAPGFDRAPIAGICLPPPPGCPKHAPEQIETLVTIHVHQRDVMNDLATLHRQKRVSDANDFEWLKQVRARELHGHCPSLQCLSQAGWRQHPFAQTHTVMLPLVTGAKLLSPSVLEWSGRTSKIAMTSFFKASKSGNPAGGVIPCRETRDRRVASRES